MKRIRYVYFASILLSSALLISGCTQKSAKRPDKEVRQETDTVEKEYRTTGESKESTTATAWGFPETMPAFTAKDLDGNEVTEAIFGEKDLTVVNIWGTFCSPCVAEMPELGEWAESMPDNVQIIGLIADIAGDEDTKHYDLAVEITRQAGAEFTQVIANADLDAVMRWVVGVPTTLFVDREGNLVGEPIIGARVDEYKRVVEEFLDEQ